MCTERHIPVIGHSDTDHLGTHLNKSGLHLNKCGTIAFTKNISNYLLELNWLSFDSSRNKILETSKHPTRSERTF